MPPVSHPFKKGALVILMNYSDHEPPLIMLHFDFIKLYLYIFFCKDRKS